MKKPMFSYVCAVLSLAMASGAAMASTPSGNGPGAKKNRFVDVVTVVAALKGYKPHDQRVALEKQRLTVLGFQHITVDSAEFAIIKSTVVVGKMNILAKTAKEAAKYAGELKKGFLSKMNIMEKGQSQGHYKTVSYTDIPMKGCKSFMQSAHYFSGYIFVQYVTDANKLTGPAGSVQLPSCSSSNNVSLYLESSH